ncbi:MAG: bi-domain-containing oxidoreductase [Planctomycetales bacterium]|nr:bi-domain-containing oxidoreductase [Planctomycetales bacterium]
MLQVVQDIGSGKTSVATLPGPNVVPGQILVANRASLVSAGTEKMVLDLSKKSLLGKARERPDHVRRVFEKIRNEGLVDTIQQVRKKLDEPMTMGYSSAGVVIACGDGVQGYKPGDRVASNGPHAEIVSVPQNLCARIPDHVPFEHASFGVLGSIALQGVRLSKTSVGETVLVVGLGLVGQLTVAMLAAAGCRVLGTDLDESKCELAMKMGAEVASSSLNATKVESLTNALGADAVIITASTKSNGPIEMAANAIRPKGRVVLVGVVGLELDRRPWYFKEAEFVVSCSYGPGRYDPNYEERGIDYPAAHVRWTEQRNIQAVLDMMGRGQLDVGLLISHRFDIQQAKRAYELIESGDEPYLGIVINYPGIETTGTSAVSLTSRPASTSGKVPVGVLGAGNFARMVLLPAMEKCGNFAPISICSAKGLSAAHTGKSHGFTTATADEDEVFANDQVKAVVSITRHDQHARHVVKALDAGKHVFVEKPLCLNFEELEEIENALLGARSEELGARDDAGRSVETESTIMVGFNRRFAPACVRMKKFFSDATEPLTVSIRFNAGDIPADHWTQHDEEGGGRIIGEACHAIDLATYLTGSVPVRVYAESVGSAPGQISDDKCFITLRHANGSISNIGYLAGGDKRFPKERIEVIGTGRVGVIDDYKVVTECRGGKLSTTKMKMDKGHAAEMKAWADCVAKGKWLIPWKELRATTIASILAVRSLREGMPFDV